MKEEEGKEEGEGSRMGPVPWGGAEGEERFHIQKIPSPVGGSTGSENSEVSEASTATGLCQAGQGKTYTVGSSHSPVCPSLRQVPAGANGCWDMGFREQIQGGDCYWL